MNRKMILCLGLVVGLVAAVAVPATAAAYAFEYEGKAIEEPIEALLRGTLSWVTGSETGWDCSKVDTRWDVETKDAKVTMVDIETGSCKGTGAYKGCTMTGDTTTGQPFTATLTSEKTIDYPKGSVDYKASCPSGTISSTVSWESLTGTFDNPAAIKTETVSGTGTSGGETVTFSGKFEVLGEVAGKLSVVK